MTELIHTLGSPSLFPPFMLAVGLMLGSFFNVVIVRLPEDRSVVRGRSHCPKCQALIPWYLNIPVLSWIYLRGKCRQCAQTISVEYPLVELASGALWLWLAVGYGPEIRCFAYGIFFSALLVVSVIDLHHRIIPDEISLPGIVLGFLAAWGTGDITLWESGGGALLGGGIFFFIAFLYEKLTGVEGLGGGDVKLLAMIGAWLGIQSILLVIVISTGAGSIIGLALMAFQKKGLKAAIPFGPFLAVAAWVYFIAQDILLPWLLGPAAFH